MLSRIIEFSIKNKLLTGLFTLALVIWGIYSLRKIPIDAVPDITNNQVQVITISPSLAAQEVERLITFPIEQAVANIPGKIELRSISRFGLSVITIVFKDNTDIYKIRQQVTERLKEAESNIPKNIGIPQLAPVTTGLGEIYQYVVKPAKGYETKYTIEQLRTLQDWVIRRQLLGTAGVADVSSFGGYLKQYEIAVNPEKLKSMNISLSQVFEALEKNNQNTGGAYIERAGNAYFIRSEGLLRTKEEIEKISVGFTKNSIPVFISNIAEVKTGHAIRYGAMTYNNEGDVTGAIVLMLKGANSSEVIDNVKKRIEEIKKTLPEGVIIEPYLDRTKLVDKAISTVTKNLAEGALIVVFVLVLLLGNIRAGMIVASVIPLAMLFALSLMNLFGVSGNLMSLGAIDFGIIVDGAVIVVEATLHHLQHKFRNTRLDKQQMDTEVYKAASRIRSSSAFGEIIILMVYLPILSLEGIEGKMFGPMAQTVGFAILGAFLLSLTYVPMMSALFLQRQMPDRKNISDRIVDSIQKAYSPLIKFALHRKWIVLSGSAVLFLLSVILFMNMGGEFIPTLEEGDFAVETRVVLGSSLTITEETAQKAAAELKKNFPEVLRVIGKVGTAEIPIDPMPMEACDLIIVLKDKSEWTSASNRDELAEKMASLLEEKLPGVQFSFQQPIQMRFNELMTGAKQDVVIKLFGENLDTLSVYAQKIGKMVSSIQGAADIYVEEVTGLPQINITYNRDNLARFGCSVEEVNKVIRTAFAGEVAGTIYEEEKRFDLVVRLDDQYRHNMTEVKRLYVSTASGLVPLEQLASIDFINGPNQIQREDAHRKIVVGFNVRNRDVESLVNEVKTKQESNIKLPAGYSITYGGAFENLDQAKKRLLLAVPLALLLIFVLLYFTFNSIKYGLLIFSAIPLSSIGGILALWLRGMPFSISAGIGFIALFGVAVLNGIVLIARFNELKKEGLQPNEIILTGTSNRLRAVIMTALVASLGFLPMALSSSAGPKYRNRLPQL